MAEFSDPTPVKNYSFFDAMMKALFSPSQATYRSLVQDPGANAGKGFLWVVIASAVSSLISIILVQVFPQNPIWNTLGEYGGEYWDMPVASFAFNWIISLICGIPAAVIFGVLGFAIAVGLLHLIARLLGGTGDFGKMAYMMALISVPFTLISSILAPIPYLGCITFLISIYIMILQVLAINAVHEFGIAKAVVTLFVPILLLCLFVFCMIVGLGAMLFPVFTEVYQSFP